MSAMKKKLAGLLLGVLAAVAGIGMVETAQASSTDTITLLVTPYGNYSVTITSVNPSGYDFGTVNVNDVTHSTAPILVKNTGTIDARWELRGENAANWSLGAAIGANTAVLQGVFASSTTTNEISTTEFTDSTDEILTTQQVAVNGGRYDFSSSVIPAGNKISANPAATNGNARSLWLRLKTPSSSSVATQQSFRLYVVAVP